MNLELFESHFVQSDLQNFIARTTFKKISLSLLLYESLIRQVCVFNWSTIILCIDVTSQTQMLPWSCIFQKCNFCYAPMQSSACPRKFTLHSSLHFANITRHIAFQADFCKWRNCVAITRDPLRLPFLQSHVFAGSDFWRVVPDVNVQKDW